MMKNIKIAILIKIIITITLIILLIKIKEKVTNNIKVLDLSPISYFTPKLISKEEYLQNLLEEKGLSDGQKYYSSPDNNQLDLKTSGILNDFTNIYINIYLP